MDLPTADTEAFLRILKDGGVGLEFIIDRGGSLLDVGQCAEVLARVRACRSIIIATAVFGRWAGDEDILSGAAAATAGELRRALYARSDERSLRALVRLARDLGFFAPEADDYADELRFEFAGAFLENPTGLRFLARGTVFSLALAVTILAAVQGKKEWDAEACRARAAGMAQMQVEMLHSLARMEGKWTSQHAASHKATVEAAQVASQACGSMLDGIVVRSHLPPGIDYEIRLGPAAPAPGP